MTHSKYQVAIFQWVLMNRVKNLFIEAKAGSGKTTTSVEITKLLPNKRILFLAFNKLIAEELQKKVPMNVEARTFNSFGNSLIKNLFKRRPDLQSSKSAFMLAEVIGIDLRNQKDADKDLKRKYYDLRGSVQRLISLYKSNYPNPWDIQAQIEKHGIEIPNYDDFEEIFNNTLEKCINHTHMIDFDDQIFLGIYKNVAMPKYDYVFIDESQDINPIIIEMLYRLKAIIIAVGDRNQAIYGFRGADAEAVDNIIAKLNCDELPLNVCYRCAKNIILEAQKIVPEIEYAENAIDGIVKTILTKEFTEMVNTGDYVLSRCTAPLVRRCLEQIRLGKKANIRGREIGNNLKELVEKILENTAQMPEFLMALQNYQIEQQLKFEAKGQDSQIQMLQDKVDTINALADDCKTPSEIITKLQSIFSDNDVEGINFSTIHKAKGLEARRIFILRYDLLPHPLAKKDWQQKQEMNLKYVAITRAKEELYFVTKEEGEK